LLTPAPPIGQTARLLLLGPVQEWRGFASGDGIFVIVAIIDRPGP